MIPRSGDGDIVGEAFRGGNHGRSFSRKLALPARPEACATIPARDSYLCSQFCTNAIWSSNKRHCLGSAFRTMDLVDAIRTKIASGQFEFSEHATEQGILRRITLQEIQEAVSHCELIEDYPDDKYGPSCLLLGFTSLRRPLHIHCSYPSRPIIKIITLYEPDPSKWIDFEVRRRDDA